MYYQVRPSQGENWSVVDDHGWCVFEGTVGQCEEWLDHQENVVRQAQRRQRNRQRLSAVLTWLGVLRWPEIARWFGMTQPTRPARLSATLPRQGAVHPRRDRERIDSSQT